MSDQVAAPQNLRRLMLPAIPGKPLLAGLVGALMLLLMYLGIITAAESFTHALQQMRTDAVWVGLVSLGLGTQVALYVRVRQLVSAAGAAQAKALTGTGTGTSTAGMIACCAHHLTDIAPLLGLTGATAFLSEYRLAFIVTGLAMNAVGIGFSVRTLRQVVRHRQEMAAGECHSAPAASAGQASASGAGDDCHKHAPAHHIAGASAPPPTDTSTTRRPACH